MPIMGGLQMMKNIRQKIENNGPLKKYKDTIFVLCTAQNENNTYPYKEAGFDYFRK
jgi:CheY-like chemotaxis protein